MFIKESHVYSEDTILSEVVVVGSGAGGSTIAKELAAKGRKVTLLERGRYHRLGTEMRALKFYTGRFMKIKPGELSRGNVELLRTIMMGGSTMVTLGNGVRALQEEFQSMGLNLEKELSETERELGVAPIPEDLMGERTRIMKRASEELGYKVKPMPKFVDFSRCTNCGMCVTGCSYGAKWTAQNYIAEARKHGARIMTESEVTHVIHSGGEVKGVKVRSKSGSFELEAEHVILAAGGIGTPRILQRSDLDSGSDLFADLFVNTFGLVEEANWGEEMGMATMIDEFHESEGFLLSPILDTKVHMLLYLPLLMKRRAFKRGKTLGLMTKIKDDHSGYVSQDSIEKGVTERDRRRLERGIEISEQILTKAGAKESSLYTTPVRGAHIGGTAGMGRVVNLDQETEISGLFVSDASVFPSAPGAPPVLTIIALSKRLSDLLHREYL